MRDNEMKTTTTNTNTESTDIIASGIADFMVALIVGMLENKPDELINSKEGDVNMTCVKNLKLLSIIVNDAELTDHCMAAEVSLNKAIKENNVQRIMGILISYNVCSIYKPVFKLLISKLRLSGYKFNAKTLTLTSMFDAKKYY